MTEVRVPNSGYFRDIISPSMLSLPGAIPLTDGVDNILLGPINIVGKGQSVLLFGYASFQTALNPAVGELRARNNASDVVGESAITNITSSAAPENFGFCGVLVSNLLPGINSFDLRGRLTGDNGNAFNLSFTVIELGV